TRCQGTGRRAAGRAARDGQGAQGRAACRARRRAGRGRARTGARPRQEVTTGGMHTYSLRDIQSMLGVSRAVITGLVASGFVTPSRGKRREYRFSFQDVVLLRTAYSLQAAQISPRKIVRSLKQLKASLPSELPLSGLRIAAVGNDIAVKEGDRHWEAESGQWLIDFEVRPKQGRVGVL